MAEVHGSCDDRFTGIRDAPAQHLDADELGALRGGSMEEASIRAVCAGLEGQR